jgi:hypothetical protein
MQDDKDKTLMGEEKDPFASIIDEQVDPFENKETDPFETSQYKQEKVEKPKKIKRDLPQEDNNDYFNPISTKAEDQVYEIDQTPFKQYRKTGLKIRLATFVVFLVVVLLTVLIQWIMDML